ncbi:MULTISPECIES: helix-turn-helix domain-containing protein [unclassified Rathayibacter]|jgi:DNA-binding transcriptional ArsR family regulator|uniref:ArsR/SmtB family transcription factor n=1 Tax=unclassified Rathayibacter TaxID=2609250 RepID=UPI000F464B43|nr:MULTISPECIES: helix-turn-helix domain-containing protein [unclassified Rathayibacter]MCJ1689437.1 helix-turn-helix domain-containing protein [Rathayibacter sp. VKM Ac-2927]ROQ05186.1 ArsR family transcriptional regulator [Rathayibacter sp. PhB93]ROQ58577.1 ArsR family transcriptional regulator [Rathayibacter sp. PhB152]ROS20861.1 ArsR family transcriptional regulator [Rathayibacter sp. PhB127]TDQ12743.1 ArsR family transcriptional regulator [Rathayibacter sp. PhB1]
MVVRIEDESDVDRLFQALADRTRRDIVARVLEAEQSVTVLAARYEMSFAAVQKHVAVLERAELVRKRRSGREQLVSGEVASLRRAARLLEAYELLWRDRVDRIADVLAEDEVRPPEERRKGRAG